jgi:ABC-type uncharacterized transport system YnjBCD ATPase subunit
MTASSPRPRHVWSAALAHTIAKPVIAIIMGVAGSGKTTVAALLAVALGCQFREGEICIRARTSRRCMAARLYRKTPRTGSGKRRPRTPSQK